jgi:hypothetical protein
LPGKALHVAVLLWRESGCTNRRTVRFRLRGGLPAGLSRWAARRGLHALKSAGLVEVTYLRGQSLQVTLRDWPRNNGRPNPADAEQKP